MTSLKSFNRRVGSLFGVAALVLATVTPGLVPTFASAAQVTERSLALSSSSKATPDVSYTIGFTSVGAAGAFVIEFCSNSPLINSACTAPAGLTVASVAVNAAGTTPGTFTAAETTYGAANDHNAIAVTGTIPASTAISVQLDHINNPTAAGPLYARIVTYGGATPSTAALAYQSTALGTDVVDQGSAAASITDSVGVSGAVLETMTFCVSGAVIDTGSCSGTLSAPTLKLGETSGDIVALNASAVSTGDIYSQISTNAVGGAVVNLKSSALSCGGLLRAGAAPGNCDIAAAGNTGINAGEAKFGVKVATAADPTLPAGVASNGAFQGANTNAYYNPTTFALNALTNNTAGVTSPYGDTFMDTGNAPVNNKNVKITFGASVANNTPAGLYSADLSLIATGKF